MSWPTVRIWTSRKFEGYRLLLELKETSLCALCFDHAILDLVLCDTQLSEITVLSLARSLCLCGSSEIVSRMDQWQREWFSLIFSLILFFNVRGVGRRKYVGASVGSSGWPYYSLVLFFQVILLQLCLGTYSVSKPWEIVPDVLEFSAECEGLGFSPDSAPYCLVCHRAGHLTLLNFSFPHLRSECSFFTKDLPWAYKTQIK